MLSFISSLSQKTEAFVVFLKDDYKFKDKKGILSKDISKKIESFASTIKSKKNKNEINSIDLSDKQKCIIVKINNNFKNAYPQDMGGKLFSFIKNYKDINDVEFYIDSLGIEKQKLINFF